jgi:hypothetical protein
VKSFKHYLAESSREYGYVIKLAHAPTDEQMDVIENYLNQFDLIEMTNAELLEHDSLDFMNIPNRAVHQINFVTGYPLSSYVCMQGMRDALNIAESLIIVRGATEPAEMNVDRHMIEIGFHDKAKADGLKNAPRLSTNREYLDIEQPVTTDIFGNDYNKKFLDYIADTKANRPSDRYHAQSPLFSWIDMDKVKTAKPVQDAADFNANYDTPKPVYRVSRKASHPVPRHALGAEGNFDDGAKHLYKMYQDKNGKRVNMSSPRAPNKPDHMRKV